MINLSNTTTEMVIALLIDVDNVQSGYIDAIEKELAILGNTTHKRLYYTSNTGISNGWGTVCTAHALNLRHVLPYTDSKNSNVKNVADSALIIDAMDILYSGHVNCICIVASDSDYTNIAKRLRESNVRVLGMGEKKTPAPFINACDEFKYLEDLRDKYATEIKGKKTEQSDGETTIPSKEEIENFITNLLNNAGKPLDAGTIKQRICQMWKNFNEENYGATKMIKFFNTKKFKIIQEQGGNVNIDLLNR